MNITVTELNLVCLKTFSYLRNKGDRLSELSKLSERFKCSECQLKLGATENGIEHDGFQHQLSCGGTPSITFCDFTFQTFSIMNNKDNY